MNHNEDKHNSPRWEVVLALVTVALSVGAFLVLGPIEGALVAVAGVGVVVLVRVLANPPSPSTPPPQPAAAEDVIDWIVEHDAHRYDPGYWTGGRLHPLLRAPGASRYGVGLILGSFVTLLMAALLASDDWSGGTILLIVGLSAVELAAGWALVKRNRKNR